MTNKDIARSLKETATLIELTGGNAFRARAFAGAARTIERLEAPVQALAAEGTLTDVPGIGAGLAAQVEELLQRGSFDARDELLAEVPVGVRQILRVKGLGTKKVRALWTQLGIDRLDALEAAAEAGKLSALPGFGAKTQQTVLHNVRQLRAYSRRRRYADALALVAPILDALHADPDVGAHSVAGELRRAFGVVERCCVVAATEKPERVRSRLEERLGRSEPAPTGADRYDLDDGFPLDLWLCAPERFGAVLWERTGSDAHVAAVRASGVAPEQVADEAGVYAMIGAPVIPPELREGSGELEAARTGALPELITVADLRGSLHNHSTYSDGAHTLREMATAAKARGLSYFGICDHSQSLKIANGMPPERVAEQQAEIARLNEELGADGAFRIFSGVESDILDDGALDYQDEVLASFDLIVASIHSGFTMTKEEATRRLVTAIENPHTTILGHPTGRLLLAREGYPIDHARVIDACAAHGVAIEVNANPYRLDLDWRWIRHAIEQGVWISINPDAHAVSDLDYVRWGVAVARKGWLTADRCLNALPLADFEAWLADRRTLA